MKHQIMEESKGKSVYVHIPHAGRYQLDELLKEVNELRGAVWVYKVWQATPALLDKASGSSTQYVGQTFDPLYFDLVQTGWTHDHCEFCSQRISDAEGYGEAGGYVSANGWLCKDCHKLLLNTKDIGTLISIGFKWKSKSPACNIGFPEFYAG